MSSESTKPETNHSHYVFDASAILAVVFAEAGAENVVPHLLTGAVSAVTLSEAAGKCVDRGRSLPDVRVQLSRLPLEVLPFDEDQAYAAAALRPIARAHNLSLGDRVCLGAAITLGRPVLTGDHAWVEVPLPVQVHLFRDTLSGQE